MTTENECELQLIAPEKEEDKVDLDPVSYSKLQQMCDDIIATIAERKRRRASK